MLISTARITDSRKLQHFQGFSRRARRLIQEQRPTILSNSPKKPIPDICEEAVGDK